MKRVVALVLPAVLGLVVAGCASAKKTVVRSTTGTRPVPNVAIRGGNGAITVTGTVTLRNVKPGTPVACKGGPRVKVPAGEAGVDATGFGVAKVSGASHTTSLELSRSAKGIVTIACSGK
ncbi:MAG TPA: hypothetical protein VJ716_07110 [Gaiellaceae bacterium]|nr:hypothetical protein [Gaiellaceae bacterium]